MTPVLAIASIAASLAYGLAFTFRDTSLLRSIVKTIPVLALTVISVLNDTLAVLSVALALGAVGDFALSREGERNFLIGLVAFLIGHLCYIALLLWIGSAPLEAPAETWRWGAMGVVALAACLVYIRLYDAFGALRVPVLIYVLVSVALGVVAIGQPTGDPYGLVVLGVMMFIFSDVILALDLFGDVHGPKSQKALQVTVWFSYWGGQSLILIGIITA